MIAFRISPILAPAFGVAIGCSIAAGSPELIAASSIVATSFFISAAKSATLVDKMDKKLEELESAEEEKKREDYARHVEETVGVMDPIEIGEIE